MAVRTVDVNKLDRPLPWWQITLLTLYLLAVMAVLVFPAAGDWRWTNGWWFVLSITANFTVSYAVINHRNPRVIRNRTRYRKSGLTDETRRPASSDRFIYPLIAIGFIGSLVVPGLGHRFGWYTLPFGVAMVGVVLANIGMVIANIATLQNAFASKILDINPDQVLVDTGLYARVRHPLYAGGILMLLAMPLALGSLWGLIPAGLAIISFLIRIRFEEEMLIKGMAGYAEYRSRVKDKLIPGIY